MRKILPPFLMLSFVLVLFGQTKGMEEEEVLTFLGSESGVSYSKD